MSMRRWRALGVGQGSSTVRTAYVMLYEQRFMEDGYDLMKADGDAMAHAHRMRDAPYHQRMRKLKARPPCAPL